MHLKQNISNWICIYMCLLKKSLYVCIYTSILGEESQWMENPGSQTSNTKVLSPCVDDCHALLWNQWPCSIQELRKGCREQLLTCLGKLCLVKRWATHALPWFFFCGRASRAFPKIFPYENRSRFGLFSRHCCIDTVLGLVQVVVHVQVQKQ